MIRAIASMSTLSPGAMETTPNQGVSSPSFVPVVPATAAAPSVAARPKSTGSILDRHEEPPSQYAWPRRPHQAQRGVYGLCSRNRTAHFRECRTQAWSTELARASQDAPRSSRTHKLMFGPAPVAYWVRCEPRLQHDHGPRFQQPHLPRTSCRIRDHPVSRTIVIDPELIAKKAKTTTPISVKQHLLPGKAQGHAGS